MVMNMNNNNVGREFKYDDIDDLVNILSEENPTGNVFLYKNKIGRFEAIHSYTKKGEGLKARVGFEGKNMFYLIMFILFAWLIVSQKPDLLTLTKRPLQCNVLELLHANKKMFKISLFNFYFFICLYKNIFM